MSDRENYMYTIAVEAFAVWLADNLRLRKIYLKNIISKNNCAFAAPTASEF